MKCTSIELLINANAEAAISRVDNFANRLSLRLDLVTARSMARFPLIRNQEISHAF